MAEKGYLTSQNRKRHQRALNREIRAFNKSLERDDLWLGRFVVRQIDSPQMVRYADGSAVDLYVKLVFIDRATGRTYKTGYVTAWGLTKWDGYEIWRKMNWLITEEWPVWDELDRFNRDFDAWRVYNKTERVI